VGRNLISPLPFKLSNTVRRDPADRRRVRYPTPSVFRAGDARRLEQLHLTVAARNDGSSTFGSGEPGNWFPKGSVAWEFTKAIAPPSWLQFGKLRLAYGSAGNEPSPYLTSTVF